MTGATGLGSAWPGVRASHLKEDLAALDALGPAVAARIRARLRPATLALIEGATRVEWLPLDPNLEMAAAVHEDAGEAGARCWGQASFLLSLDGYFRSLLGAVRALFAPTPATYYRLAGKAWPSVYRGCGSLVSAAEGTEAVRIEAVDFPPELLTPPFLHALAGTIQSPLVMSGHPGAVVLERWDPHGGTASYLATWRSKG